MKLRPEAVHPSHDVREEGWYVSDPRCQKCRLSPDDHPQSLRAPCGQPVTTTMWEGREARYL